MTRAPTSWFDVIPTTMLPTCLLLTMLLPSCQLTLTAPTVPAWRLHCNNLHDPVNITDQCRTRKGYLSPADYRVCTCGECYVYLFQKPLPVTVASFLGNLSQGQTSLQDNLLHSQEPVPDVSDSVCGSLSRKDCVRLRTCCRDAMMCCQKQAASGRADDSLCPMTWDGYSCVEATRSGQVAEIKCPSFLVNSRPQDRAHRLCGSNGSWWREPVHGQEWTNYSSCVDVDLKSERAAELVAIVCNGVSILFLVPAILIFLAFRQLRCQRHVKLHIHLCVSLLLTSLTSLMMEKLVYYDGMAVDEPDKRFQYMHQSGCKVLNILDLLFQMCPPFWMLCEGFYLTRLLLRAFQPLKHITGFYLFGWGVPVITIIIFTITTSQLEESDCWLEDSNGLQWMVYAPAIACIAVNLLLFLIILKVLLTQIQTHSREPNNFRRVLKATVILIPLFGLQQFCIIYSPSSSVPGFMVYNIAREVIIHSQGLLVALIFCFCNTEVHNQLSMAYKRWRQGNLQTSRRTNINTSLSSLATLHRPSVPDLTGVDLASLRRPSVPGLPLVGLVTSKVTISEGQPPSNTCTGVHPGGLELEVCASTGNGGTLAKPDDSECGHTNVNFNVQDEDLF